MFCAQRCFKIVECVIWCPIWDRAGNGDEPQVWHHLTAFERSVLEYVEILRENVNAQLIIFLTALLSWVVTKSPMHSTEDLLSPTDWHTVAYVPWFCHWLPSAWVCGFCCTSHLYVTMFWKTKSVWKLFNQHGGFPQFNPPASLSDAHTCHHHMRVPGDHPSLKGPRWM